MSAVNSLVPARFLTITAHLVIVITIFWSRENNVKACLPLDFTQEQYDSEDKKLVTALAITIAIGAHASASVALVFFLFEHWECGIYWWIFVFCSVLPACVEILLLIAVFGLKKKPL
eukprot:XP_011604126.1 PREDICTED: transmembrane protein 107 isoform X3 [Takifugu rubripes]